MKLNLKAMEMKMTPAIKQYLEKKLGALKKLMIRYELRDTVMADAELGMITKKHQAGKIFKAEVHLCVSGHDFNATAAADDLYAAIDKVEDELKREITTYKDRKTSQQKKGGREIKKILKNIRT